MTAEDVRFSFEAFADSVLDAPARPYLTGVTVVPEDSATILVRFPAPSAEQLYDATFHVRVLPSHIWARLPKAAWAADTSVAHLVGSGPYRVAEWKRGEFVRLVADTTAPAPPRSGEAVWRFAPDPDAALNLVLSHEADLLETAGSPDRQARGCATPPCDSCPTPPPPTDSSGFGSPAGRRAGRTRSSRDAPTRRALALAVDRETLARSAFGHEAKAPPGPMSQLLWIWSDSIRVAPVRHRAGRSRARCRGLAPARQRDHEAAWQSRARVRHPGAEHQRHAGDSSPWRCRRCGRRSAPP